MEITHLQPGMVNAYLIKTGSESFLIDTGLPMKRNKLKAALEREGVAPGDIKLVIATHGDFDHIGNCAWFQKKYGVKIAIHEADAGLCRTGKSNLNRIRTSSVISRIPRKILFALLFKPLMKKYPLELFEPDIFLSDGQDLRNYGLDAMVFHLPGHSSGSIGIYTDEGDFFSGDTINNRRKPAIGDLVENLASLEATITKIRSLKIRNVYPGHGKPFAMTDMTF